MKADIESQLSVLNEIEDYNSLSDEQKRHIEARKKYLQMVLDSPCYQINEKTLNFIY